MVLLAALNDLHFHKHHNFKWEHFFFDKQIRGILENVYHRSSGRNKNLNRINGKYVNGKSIDFNFWFLLLLLLLMLMLLLGAYIHILVLTLKIIPMFMLVKCGWMPEAKCTENKRNNQQQHLIMCLFHCFVAKQNAQPHCLFGSAGFFFCYAVSHSLFQFSFSSIPMNSRISIIISGPPKTQYHLFARINILL